MAIGTGGGGGGAGAAGSNATSGVGGAGGVGNVSSLSGSSVTYGSGGGGGAASGSGGAAGGTGAGAGSASGAGSAASANTGAGGGGGGPTSAGGAGGSGIIILTYAGAQQLTAGTYSYVNGNSIHTVTANTTATYGLPTITWVTAAGNIGNIYTGTTYANAATVVANVSAGTVSYAVTSGALPSGLTLGSANGVISGTTSNVVATSTFTVTANTTASGTGVARSFSLTTSPPGVSTSYLIVGGGGSGGFYNSGYSGGGGGGGGVVTGTTTLTLASSYTVTVGAGGAAAQTGNGSNGSSSQVGCLTAAIGGGAGGNYNSGGAARNGVSGASGGGGSGGNNAPTGGSGTQGNNGGNGANNTSSESGGGGGGGAGAVGSAGSGTTGGAGGNGLTSSISGTSTYYGGGGGGGGATPGAGGLGGGAIGGSNNQPTPGSANTGGGGGGDDNGAGSPNPPPNHGGSGIVIISYAAPQKFGGGVVTTSGSNVIHTFTTSGTLTPISSLSASYLIVAGGGGGGFNYGAGGGGGGLLSGSGVTIDTNSIYLVTVGAGGLGATSSGRGSSGSNSSFSIVTTSVVGGGGGGGNTATTGASGGSGGGGGGNGSGAVGGSATSGQGNNGGSSFSGSPGAAGGGGGAGAVGGTGTSGVGGVGGAGASSSISGSSVTYAGGGGGNANGTDGAGGAGGGGAAGNPATNGTANLGGGGGGSGTSSGNGGSGVVIISYAGSVQQMAGGTVTISGGNVIHTFTSSGYLTPLKLVNNSLRFRSSNNAYLSRTPTVTGSQTTWTWSGWLKIGILSQTGLRIFDAGSGSIESGLVYNKSGSNYLQFEYYSGSSYTTQCITNASFRDPAAWYHVVVVADTTQATASNRVKIYVNGVLQTLGTATYPSQNATFAQNTAGTQNTIATLSKTPSSAYGFDGYMTEINFIDGQALTPNSFGTFNSYGVWQPITYGGSYGTNGFYLPFTHNGSTYVGTFSTGNYLTAPNSSAFNLTGDFTIEAYVYPTATAGSNNSEILAYGYSSGFDGWHLAQLASSNYLAFNLNYAGIIVQTSSAVPLNQWSHVAVCRSGTSFYIFINGILLGTATSSATQTTNASDKLYIGTASYDQTSARSFTGSISNARVVKGTALYTSNFVPSTTSLTNVANTSILTLQNSPIVDNSSNAFTITTVGTVNSTQTYPFAYAIFADQSPQQNNWTPNNISGQSGSTLDYMTDVPTLTSATAANYAVWNPLSRLYGTPTITDGNLKATGTAGGSIAAATIAMSTTGKWYAETTVLALGSSVSVGVCNQLPSRSKILVYQNNGQKNLSGTVTAYGSSYTTNDVIGIAVDCDGQTVTFYKNNVSQGSISFSSASITSADMVFECYTDTSGDSIGLNCGQQPFKYTAPSGYVALNTYNM